LSILNLLVVGSFAVALGMTAGLWFSKTSHAISIPLLALFGFGVLLPMSMASMGPLDIHDDIASPLMHSAVVLASNQRKAGGMGLNDHAIKVGIASLAWTFGYAVATLLLCLLSYRMTVRMFAGPRRLAARGRATFRVRDGV
jgi:hypothetical protein